MSRALFLSALLLTACGGASDETEPVADTDDTAGDEAPAGLTLEQALADARERAPDDLPIEVEFEDIEEEVERRFLERFPELKGRARLLRLRSHDGLAIR